MVVSERGRQDACAPRVEDSEVEITPKDALAGRDAQIEKAIQVGLEEIKKNVPVRPIQPTYPVHP